MATTEEILVEIEIENKKLKKALTKSEKLFENTFKNIKKTSSSTDIMKGVLGADALKAGLREAGEIIKSGLQKIVSETSQLEDATLDWDLLTGSAEEASKRITDVYKFANSTPFDTKEVNTAATNLYKVSQGALGAESDLIRLGDAAKKGNVPIVELSTTYGRLYSKMANGEKAFGDEINRMTDLGLVTFKTKQALQDMDASLLKTEGLKLLNADLDAANGTMERFSNTISGKLGTLSSTWDQIFAFDDEEMQKTIGDSIGGFTKALEDNTLVIQAILKDIFGVITYYATEWVQIFSDWYRKFNPDLKKMEDQMFTAESNLNAIRKKHQADLDKAKASGNAAELEAVKKRITDEQQAMYKKKDDWNTIINLNNSLKKDLPLGIKNPFNSDGYGAETKKVIKEITGLLDSGEMTKEDAARILDLTSTETFGQTLNPTLGVKNTLPLDFIDAAESMVQKFLNETKLEKYLETIAVNTKVEKDIVEDIKKKTTGSTAIDDYTNITPYEGHSRTGYYDESFGINQAAVGAASGRAAEMVGYGTNAKVAETDKVERHMLAGMTTMVSSTDQGFINMNNTIENWSKKSLVNFADIGQNVSDMVSGVASGYGDMTGTDLGSLIPGLGLASAGFGIMSTLASILQSDSEDAQARSITSDDDDLTSQRATIVSSGAGDVYNTNTFNFDGCIVDDVAMTEWIEKDVIPKLDNITAGVN